MTSGFNVHDAAGYEQLMGRWSQKLAPLFIDFAKVADGEKILDVGCGTGSLTFALARAADLGEIAAIDYSPVFVEEAIRRSTDPRIKVQQADACALPFEGLRIAAFPQRLQRPIFSLSCLCPVRSVRSPFEVAFSSCESSRLISSAPPACPRRRRQGRGPTIRPWARDG